MAALATHSLLLPLNAEEDAHFFKGTGSPSSSLLGSLPRRKEMPKAGPRRESAISDYLMQQTLLPLPPPQMPEVVLPLPSHDPSVHVGGD